MVTLSAKEHAGLCWLREWSRSHITRLKRRRKYLPRGAPFDPNEADLLRTLLDLEQSASRFLEVAENIKSQISEEE